MPAGGGAYEMYEMQLIDFRDAQTRFPKNWSLTAPPEGSAVHDKIPPKIDVAAQIEVESAKAASPPIMKRRNPSLNPI
jgi:hypothetical protein